MCFRLIYILDESDLTGDGVIRVFNILLKLLSAKKCRRAVDVPTDLKTDTVCLLHIDLSQVTVISALETDG